MSKKISRKDPGYIMNFLWGATITIGAMLAIPLILKGEADEIQKENQKLEKIEFEEIEMEAPAEIEE